MAYPPDPVEHRGKYPEISISCERGQVEITSDGTLGVPASVAREFIPGLTTVRLTINGDTFLLTPEEYAESVEEWREALNLAGKRRLS
ncbi:MAG TPA: hypothetical protein VLA89_09965 [Gemmatimonadales bacterium]|nr:hypothetical protein [Gemmatimonadales bacterium]